MPPLVKEAYSISSSSTRPISQVWTITTRTTKITWGSRRALCLRTHQKPRPPMDAYSLVGEEWEAHHNNHRVWILTSAGPSFRTAPHVTTTSPINRPLTNHSLQCLTTLNTLGLSLLRGRMCRHRLDQLRITCIQMSTTEEIRWWQALWRLIVSPITHSSNIWSQIIKDTLRPHPLV